MFPEYCQEVRGLAHRITRRLSIELNPITMGQKICHSSMYAYDSSIDGVGKGSSNPRNELIGKSLLQHDCLLNCNLDAWHFMLFEISEEFASQLQKSFFSMLDAVTEKTGNRKNLEGRALTFDDVTSAIEMMDGITIDENGVPNITLVMTDDFYMAILKNGMPEPTDEEKRRRDEVIKRKKEEADAQKCVRSLAWISL